MFTGIVDHCGIILELKRTESSLRITVQTRFSDLVEGESIAVDGACLTLISPKRGRFECDISSETNSLTIVSSYRPNSAVNLERALRLSDRMGGHWVNGHVDQTAILKRRGDVIDESGAL